MDIILNTSKNNNVHTWWINFSAHIISSIRADSQPLQGHEYMKKYRRRLQVELKQYGGVSNEPFYESIKFENDARAFWFILKWS